LVAIFPGRSFFAHGDSDTKLLYEISIVFGCVLTALIGVNKLRSFKLPVHEAVEEGLNDQVFGMFLGYVPAHNFSGE
jgi:hypothetical protein